MTISVQSLIPNCRGETTLGDEGQGSQVTGLPGSGKTRSETDVRSDLLADHPPGPVHCPRTVTLKTKPGARDAESLFLLAYGGLANTGWGRRFQPRGETLVWFPHFARSTFLCLVRTFGAIFGRDFWARRHGQAPRSTIRVFARNPEPRDRLFPQRSEIPRVFVVLIVVQHQSASA